MIELLAPAGDLEKLKIAYQYGADAVFIGGTEFSLRSRASNFTLDEIQEAADFAHSLNKKLYVTANIIPHEEDMPGLKEYLLELEKIGIDAIIAASPYIIDTALKYTKLEVHLSTQYSSTNSNAVNFWKKKGVKRVVLARELSLDEIKQLRKNTSLDIECFIHGGMCMSYSGRCALSNNMANRDANRGGCAHSCRWNYKIDSVDTEVNFSLSSKDLMAISEIPNLIEIGVNSLKIEGRMKSLHYVATVVKVYRMAIDEYYKNKCIENIDKYKTEILKAENRMTHHGYFHGIPDSNGGLYNQRSERPTQSFIGIVLNYDEKTNICTLEQRNYFEPKGLIEFFSPNKENIEFTIEKIYDENMNELDCARHPKQIIKFSLPFKVEPFTFVRKL